MNKYICIGGFLFFLSLCCGQQPPNPGFEQWTGISTSSPKDWHSYDEAAGIFSGTASNKGGGKNPALERTNGHSGKYAVVIRCNKIIGVAANGALTCGRVYMGAISASSPKNYCYTDRNNGYCCHFTNRPDSVYFWAKFKMKGKETASAKAHLHTDCDFRDFVDIGSKANIASAILYFQDKGNGQWHQYKQAFKAYDKPQKATAEQAPIPTVSQWTQKPSYLLFSFTTNRHVMKGNQGDALYIDDIQFVYNKRLSMIFLDNEPMPFFDAETNEYIFYLPQILTNQLPTVTAETESPRAKIVIRQATIENPEAEIQVLHDDVVKENAQPKTYKILFLPQSLQFISKNSD